MRAILILLVVAVAAGCAPRDREVRLARVLAEKRNLEATLDRLEERLLVDQARVRFWQEMKERHESVSAIACAVQDSHLQAMVARALPHERSSLHQARIAAASPGVSKPRVRTDEGR